MASTALGRSLLVKFVVFFANPSPFEMCKVPAFEAPRPVVKHDTLGRRIQNASKDVIEDENSSSHPPRCLHRRPLRAHISFESSIEVDDDVIELSSAPPNRNPARPMVVARTPSLHALCCVSSRCLPFVCVMVGVVWGI